MNTFFSLQQEINVGNTVGNNLVRINALPLLIRILLRGNNEQYYATSPYQEIMNKYVKIPAEKRLMRRNSNRAGFNQWHNGNSKIYFPFLKS